MPAFAVSGAVPARVTVRAELRPQPRRTSALGLGPRPQLVPCRTFTAPKPASVAAMPAPSTTAVQGFFSSIFDPSGMAEYNAKIQAGQDVTQVSRRGLVCVRDRRENLSLTGRRKGAVALPPPCF